MREIKFRAWDKKNKCFVDFEKEHWWIEPHTGKPQSGEDYEIYGDAEDFVITQFTGSKDTDGKEIYEGDIVEKDKDVFEIDYTANYGFSSNVNVNAGATLSSYKVIGNIYENPELLKVEN